MYTDLGILLDAQIGKLPDWASETFCRVYLRNYHANSKDSMPIC